MDYVAQLAATAQVQYGAEYLLINGECTGMLKWYYDQIFAIWFFNATK